MPRAYRGGFGATRRFLNGCQTQPLVSEGDLYLNPTGFSPFGVLGGRVKPRDEFPVARGRLPYIHTHPKAGRPRQEVSVARPRSLQVSEAGGGEGALTGS